MASELSQAAKAICEKHYNFKSRSSCNPCPLRAECHKPCQHLNQASLDEWRDRVNRLAEPLPHGQAECLKGQAEVF